MFAGQPIIVVDLETARSAEDCRHCGHEEERHSAGFCPPGETRTAFQPIGWRDYNALGLSIGAYWDYQMRMVHWFDRHTLEATMQRLVDEQPLMVSFNGIGFDFALMRALLRREAEEMTDDAPYGHSDNLVALCDDFKALAARSYDILAEIWAAAPDDKYERGLNSLDAILAANALPPKTGHGAQAPRDWQAGKIAQVLNYCQWDVLATKALFELICTTGGVVQRRSGPLQIRRHIWQSEEA